MDKTQKILDDTGERMIPEKHKGSLIYAEHITRYLSATELVAGKTVLDIACGTGYGSKLMSDKAKKVIGVDIDELTIEYAKEHYPAKNIDYLVGAGEEIPVKDSEVDAVITFETIEHLKDYRKFIEEIKRVLKPTGLAIVSTPNDLEFAEGNHFHLHEFNQQELVNLLKKQFKYVAPYYQATWKSVLIGDDKLMSTEGPIQSQIINYAPTTKKHYLYFYFLCSDRKINEGINPILGLGEHYSDRDFIGMQMTHEKNLNDYKIVVDDLQQRLNNLAEINKQLNAKLSRITNMRAYKMAKKIKSAGKRIKNVKKS